MNWLIAVLVCGLILFAVGSAVREMRLYRKAVRGDIEYLVSRPRRNRRLLVSFLLLVEAAFLFAGTFLLPLTVPHSALLYWIAALIVMILVIALAFRDLKETRRDLDRIFHEAMRSALKSANEARKK